MNSVISIRGLTKRYRGCDALMGVDLDVPKGVVFAVLGENGAGKTTMIKILTGFLKADSGTASVLGLDCGRDALEIRRRVGYVSDSPAMYEWMRVEEIGWFAAGFYPDGFLTRYHELLDEFEVPLGRKLKSLSKGQRAKVALALSISHEPDLLIMDEPTSGLDPVVRRQFLESMVDRAATGRTVLLSSHHVNEVERVADYVAIVHGGKLRLCQPLADLKESVTELTLSLKDPAVAVPIPDCEVLNLSQSGRPCRMTVQSISDEQIEQLRSHSSIVELAQTTPSLEDIFVACTHGSVPGMETDGDDAFSGEAHGVKAG